MTVLSQRMQCDCCGRIEDMIAVARCGCPDHEYVWRKPDGWGYIDVSEVHQYGSRVRFGDCCGACIDKAEQALMAMREKARLSTLGETRHVYSIPGDAFNSAYPIGGRDDG